MQSKTTQLSALLAVAFLYPSVAGAQTVEWTRQFGTSADVYSHGVSADAFGNVYVTGETERDLDGLGPGTHAGGWDAFIRKYDSRGVLAWTRQFGTSGDDAIYGVSADDFGNVYISGVTEGDLDGAGPGANAGDFDAFISKYDSSGVLAWTRQIGSSGWDSSRGVSTDTFGNVYISGYTEGDIDGAGEGTSSGDYDAFVSKYDSNGVLAWTKQIGSSAFDNSRSVSTDAFGNVYISGYTEGDIDGAGAGTSAGLGDAFVSKYDSSGTLIWTKQLGTSNSDGSRSVTTDAFGNVYIAGWTQGDIDGAGATAGIYDAFITKYNSNGTLDWTRQIGTSNRDASYGISVDAFGNVYTTGYEQVDVDGAGTYAGDVDIFVSKYDSNGILAWTRQLGTSSRDAGHGISADAFGNVYISGYTEGDLDGAGPGRKAIGRDAFLIKIHDVPESETVELVPRGSLWSYLDDGTNQGTAWREAEFDDSAWEAGPAQLGYGDGDEATVVSFGSNGSNKHITTYFRHWFEVDDASRVIELALGLLRDDGAAVYLNGVEVRRDNLTFSSVFNESATDTVARGDEDVFSSLSIDRALLHDGMNLLAVEVHQTSRTSSDISFDLGLTAWINPVPEPGSLSTLAIALGVLLCRRRRRK